MPEPRQTGKGRASPSLAGARLGRPRAGQGCARGGEKYLVYWPLMVRDEVGSHSCWKGPVETASGKRQWKGSLRATDGPRPNARGQRGLAQWPGPTNLLSEGPRPLRGLKSLGPWGLSPKLPFVLSVWALDPSPQFFLSRLPKEDGISATGDKHLSLRVWAPPTAGAHASPSHLNLALVWAGNIKPACRKLPTPSPSGAFMSPPRQNLLKVEPWAKCMQKPICPTRHTKGW